METHLGGSKDPPLQGRGSANHLRPRDIARLIEQRIHAFKEPHRVGQSRMGLECGFVHPARMNVEEPAVPHRAEGVETEATRLLPRWPCHLAQRLFHRTLFSLTRIQPHESVLLHAPSVSRLHSLLHLTAHYCSFWGRVEGRARYIMPLRGRRSEEPGSRAGHRHGRGRRDEFRPPLRLESQRTGLKTGHYTGRAACRHARTPGDCCASTPLRRACANTCSRSRRVCALMRARPAPMKRPGDSPRCCTISITSAGPTRSTPPSRGIPPKAQRFCAKWATPRRSSARSFLTRTIATCRANPRWSTRSSPATSWPAS